MVLIITFPLHTTLEICPFNCYLSIIVRAQLVSTSWLDLVLYLILSLLFCRFSTIHQLDEKILSCPEILSSAKLQSKWIFFLETHQTDLKIQWVQFSKDFRNSAGQVGVKPAVRRGEEENSQFTNSWLKVIVFPWSFVLMELNRFTILIKIHQHDSYDSAEQSQAWLLQTENCNNYQVIIEEILELN